MLYITRLFCYIIQSNNEGMRDPAPFHEMEYPGGLHFLHAIPPFGGRGLWTRKTLNISEAQKKGDTTLEELSGTSENFADPADRATAESDRAFTLRIRDRERRLIKKVKEALQRIDDGTYGICEECGEEISLSRLKARPVTRLCINCKAKQEEEESQRGD